MIQVAESTGIYETLINQVTGESWDNLLSGFDDASIYQSWAYSTARWGDDHLSTLVLNKDGKLAAAALVRCIFFPAGTGGIAYLGWGPAWRVHDQPEDHAILRRIIRELKNEFSHRRKLFLKVSPNICCQDSHIAKQIFIDEGFEWHAKEDTTLIVGLDRPILELRTQLRRSWRQLLVKAEKAGLELIQGTEVELYDAALEVYRQMHTRKKFVEFVDKNQFRKMQAALPKSSKMQILLIRESGVDVAALSWATIGETGLPLLAATGSRALKLGAANLMWWKMLDWLKANGFRFCDLGGIDPVQNPGGFTFKSGIAGDEGATVTALGSFDICSNPVSRLVANTGLTIRDTARRMLLWSERFRKNQATKPTNNE